MDLLAFILALQAEGKTAEEVKAAVDEYLEENPGAIDQAAVEAIVGEALAEQNAKLDDIEDDVGGLKSAISDIEDEFHGILVSDSPLGDPVTLTNAENVNNLYQHISGVSGWGTYSYSDGLLTLLSKAGNTEKSPYFFHSIASGEKKWLCGFKYKLTKLDQTLGDPENVRVYLGASQYYDAEVSWGNWVEFAQIATVDLTKIQMNIRNFAVAPVADQLKVEIKEMYLYDVTGVASAMCDYIIEQQSTNYTDGTVTYGNPNDYFPDTTLEQSGKAADSKAVGDAIAEVEEEITENNEEIDARLDVSTKTLEASLENKSTLSSFAAKYGLQRDSLATNLEVFSPSSSPDKSPALQDTCALGSKKWLIGFKYKLTKLDGDLGDPECIRLIFGDNNNTDYIDYNVVYGSWVEICEMKTVNLTKLYFQLRKFDTAPTAGQLQLEIKDYYIYDISSVDTELLNYVIDKQSTDYTDGEVDYKLRVFSDQLSSSLDTINVKNYGVKGDGETDDTLAIKSLFSLRKGNFYFPAGTYIITGTIELPENSNMIGDGDDTVIDMHSCDNLQSCIFNTSGGWLVYPYILVQSDNVSIKKIKVIGNNTLQDKRHAAICILDAKNCKVEDVTVYNINFDANQDEQIVMGYGICVNRSDFVDVVRVNAQRCGYECIGIVFDCNHCTVRDCYTQDGWRTCIQVHAGSCNTLVENCYMKQTHDKYDACFTVHGLSEQLVKNLRVINCTHECTQNGAQTQEYCAPMQIMSYAEAPVFMGNRVLGGKRAFYITNSSNHARIIGNDFQCNEDSDYGVYINAPSSIVIGNSLLNEASTPVNHIGQNPIIIGNIGIS